MITSPTYSDRNIEEPVSILLPVCNEAELIESVLAELVEVVYRHLPDGSEFLIQEGGSTDGTKEILRDLNKRWPFLDILYKEDKEGFENAARELYRRASCPLVFFADSDGQCVASEFWKLADKIGQADFVQGVKKVRYDPLLRKLASRGFNWLARHLLKLRSQDLNFGFRLSRRKPLLECLARCRYMPLLLNAEILVIANLRGYRILETRVFHRPRLSGMSRGLMPGSLPKESWRVVHSLIKLRRNMAAIRAEGKTG